MMIYTPLTLLLSISALSLSSGSGLQSRNPGRSFLLAHSHQLPQFRASQPFWREPSHLNLELLHALRGGGSSVVTDDSKEKNESTPLTEEENSSEDGENAPSQTSASPESSILSSRPVKLLIQTNWGSPAIDQRVELTVVRTRTIASLKQSLSRLLPGRPPMLGLELVYEGRVLEDEMLVDELFDGDAEDDDDSDDDDEEDEMDDGDGDNVKKVLTLNVIPPVDPKFATTLASQLKSEASSEDDVVIPTEEILKAYFLNQAAIARNAQLLANPNLPTSPLLALEMREHAKSLQDIFQAQIPEKVWLASLKMMKKSNNAEERRGQRYRKGGNRGVRTDLKKTLQTNLNIEWGETIRNSLLFLFFGYFGGRHSFSRAFLLFCAPMCFILQARPVKLWIKSLFYMLSNPPGVLSSLLPAPQQAILNFDWDKEYAALYGSETESSAIGSSSNDDDNDNAKAGSDDNSEEDLEDDQESDKDEED